MILKRFYDEKLAQASYLFGCAATGDALIIDPNREVDLYLEAAEAEGLRITSVAETHIHADFVSGARELARRTDARLYLSREGGPDWQYTYAEEEGAVLIGDDDSFKVGNIRIEVMHTPGHTPEHISFLVTDTAGADEPMGIVTGDFVFVGDVGRPDLLEKAAGVKDTMIAAARDLFASLQRFKKLPDYLQIWPGHGAGSACGKGLGAVPQSTVGYERRYNWGLKTNDEEEFVQMVLAGQPEPPKYFAQMKRINKEGPELLGGLHKPERLAATALASLLEGGAIVVDTRPADAFAASHAEGTLNIPAGRTFTTWAGWLLPYDEDFYLLIDEQCAQCPAELRRDLATIGLDRVAGFITSNALDRAAVELETIEEMSVDELHEKLNAREVEVIDVRGQTEWEEGHLPGAKNIALGYLEERVDELPRDKPVVVHCLSGARSAIAASLLKAKGMDRVYNLDGGYKAWHGAGKPVERGG